MTVPTHKQCQQKQPWLIYTAFPKSASLSQLDPNTKHKKITEWCKGMLDTNLVPLSSVLHMALHSAPNSQLRHLPPPRPLQPISSCCGTRKGRSRLGALVGVGKEHWLFLPITGPYITIFKQEQPYTSWGWEFCNLPPSYVKTLDFKALALAPCLLLLFQVLLSATATLLS